MADDENEDAAAKRPGWLARAAPGIRRRLTGRKTPENLWFRCPDTGDMLYRPDLEAALWVTPSGRHLRLTPAQRFAFTFDDGRYKRIASPKTPDDPLSFSFGKSYPEALASARKATGDRDALTAATGKIGGAAAVVLVQNFAFMAASVSTEGGEAFLAAAAEAVKHEAALVVFTSGAGMRMQEGAVALMQMARITVAIQQLRQKQLPYVVVLTDPTTGGTLASYAMLGDVSLAEPGALIGFTGRRVIEQTIRETLPPWFQTAEFQEERGMVDQVVARRDLPAQLAAILKTAQYRLSVA